MLSPSTAPRWKIATRIFLRRPGPSAAYTDLDSQPGIEPTPKMAQAVPFRNARREAIKSPSLKIRRADHQPGNQPGCLLFLLRQSLLDAGLRLWRSRTAQQRLGRQRRLRA